MSWLEKHRESEQLAIEAEVASRSRDLVLATSLYRGAAEAEQRALEQVDVSKPRTLGITAVSAVALWFRAKEYVAAEQLAHAVLARGKIPDFARRELRNLVQAIWIESAKEEAGLSFVPGEVLVSVKGGDVITGGAPLDLIIDKVQIIQSLFYRTIELLKDMPLRRVGRPPPEIQNLCRPWLFQSIPGSYQFAVAVEKPGQLDFFAKDIEPDQIANHFLQIINASSSKDSEGLEKLVPTIAYRNTFLKLTRNLAPTGKLFERIELRTVDNPKPISLDSTAREQINQRLREAASSLGSPLEIPEEVRGVLRAVHLDKDWLEIGVENALVHVDGLQDTVDDVIGQMVNRNVLVRVLRGPNKRLRFVDVELVDE